MNKNIKDLTINELKDYLKEIGEKEFRAKQIFEWIIKKKALSFDEISVFSQTLKDKLKSDFELASINVKSKRLSQDGTIKYLFAANRGGSFETALIPSGDGDEEKSDRLTLCISTQIGCPVDCIFCATGKIGFIRNLNVCEIIDQILFAEKDSGKEITNIVLMGMGEPLLNFANVIEAIKKITDANYGFISQKRITLSTVGITAKINELASSDLKIKLAISLHSPFQKTREELIPFAKANDIKEIINSAENYYKTSKMPVTFEYALFDGINDRDEDAIKLAKICRRFPSKINIIKYNSIDFIFDNPLKPSQRLNAFVKKIQSEGANVFIRISAGSDIEAACGQLAAQEKKEE